MVVSGVGQVSQVRGCKEIKNQFWVRQNSLIKLTCNWRDFNFMRTYSIRNEGGSDRGSAPLLFIYTSEGSCELVRLICNQCVCHIHTWWDSCAVINLVNRNHDSHTFTSLCSIHIIGHTERLSVCPDRSSRYITRIYITNSLMVYLALADIIVINSFQGTPAVYDS
jgi:hypothetical protein